MARARGLLLVVVGVLALSLAGVPVSAYWSAGGSGSAGAASGSLAPPTGTTVPAAAFTDVPVSWTPGVGGVTPDGYVVTRTLTVKLR